MAPSDAALNCLHHVAQHIPKDVLKEIPWDQVAREANMSSGKSLRDTMRRHCKNNGWFGETGASASTTAAAATAAAADATAATAATTAAAAASGTGKA